MSYSADPVIDAFDNWSAMLDRAEAAAETFRLALNTAEIAGRDAPVTLPQDEFRQAFRALNDCLEDQIAQIPGRYQEKERAIDREVSEAQQAEIDERRGHG